MRQIKKRIIDHHGRIENIKLFNRDPTPYIEAAKEKEIQRIKAEQEAAKAKALAEQNGEDIEEKKEAAPAATEEEEDKGPDYVEYDDIDAMIYDIFKEFGAETKDEADQEPDKYYKELYYDFTPFNAKDPVLLSLMTTVK